MSIQSEIGRIQAARDAIAGAITAKGVAVPDSTRIDGMAEKIAAIKTGAELSIVVTVNTGAIVNATKGDHIVSGVSVDGTCALTVPEAGTWTISATQNGQNSELKTIDIPGSFALDLKFINATFNLNSWSTIRAVSDEGKGANYWSLGDWKAFMINSTVGEVALSSVGVYAFIIGFDHNASIEGENRIHIQLAKRSGSGVDIAFCDDLYGSAGSSDVFRMNKSNINSGGWDASFMRNTICGTNLINNSGTMIAALDKDLQAVLKPVTKYTDNTAGGAGSVQSNVTASTEYLFLLSEYEVFGAIVNGNTYEASKQLQYDYYKVGNSKVKYNHKEPTTAISWWLRSPVAGRRDTFLRVTINGTSLYSNASTSYGLAPAFCI